MKKGVLIISLLINVLLIGYIVKLCLFKPRSNNQINYFLNRNKYLDILPNDSSSIVFGGDSHIQNFELAEMFKSTVFKNRGISYDTSLGLLHRIDELTNGNPSKIFIEIGTNDANQRIPVENTISNINSILNSIQSKSPRTQVYLQSVMPNKFNLSQILILNKNIQAIADARHLTFINLDPYFLSNGLKKQYDSGDGVHLNGEGYLKWKDVLKKYL